MKKFSNDRAMVIDDGLEYLSAKQNRQIEIICVYLCANVQFLDIYILPHFFRSSFTMQLTTFFDVFNTFSFKNQSTKIQWEQSHP